MGETVVAEGMMRRGEILHLFWSPGILLDVEAEGEGGVKDYSQINGLSI